MEHITHYKLMDDGTYTVVVSGLKLEDDDVKLLQSNQMVKVDLKFHDPKRISEQQRKLIFALCNDIEKHTGTPSELMRRTFTHYLKFMNGSNEDVSLSDCSKRVASDLIDLIMTWTFQHDIPLNYETSNLMKEDSYFIYLATLNRKCVICGTNGDLAHEDAVGAGRDRKKHDHSEHRILCLCRNHHREQHQIGITTFNELYHLKNAWLKVTPELNKKLQGK